jgi:phosphate transport system permease protein
LKKIFEKAAHAVLFTSSTVSIITVLLIILFLFREGVGLFGKKPIEDGQVLLVNKLNPVSKLTSDELKNIFDQEYTNWRKVGGTNDSILLFRIDDIFNYYTEEELAGIDTNIQLLNEKVSELVGKQIGMVAFISKTQLVLNNKVKIIEVEPVSVSGFFGGELWFPTSQPAAQFGVLPLLLGTLWVSLLAILIALPFGLATAVYMAEIARPSVRSMLKPVVELLAGIPSVVYGFFGLIVIVPLVQQLFNLPVGETGLAGSIVLAIMALPTIITVAEDSIRNTPRSMKEASLALGATHWQTIYRVIIPYASSGITAAVILGIGRAIGETMAVLMVTGNAAIIPHTILQPMRTIPATIAAELGEAAKGGMHYKALFALGCILFLITMLVNITVEFISGGKRIKR